MQNSDHSKFETDPARIAKLEACRAVRRKGFTLVEVILAVVVLGVLALVLGNAFSDVTDNSVDKTKTYNAWRMTSYVRDAIALGANMGAGVPTAPNGDGIDTTSMATIIASLEGGLNLNGARIDMGGFGPNPAAYTYSAGPPPTISPVLGQPNVSP